MAREMSPPRTARGKKVLAILAGLGLTIEGACASAAVDWKTFRKVLDEPELDGMSVRTLMRVASIGLPIDLLVPSFARLARHGRASA